jgi:quinoprotein glucose dehydrogenase
MRLVANTSWLPMIVQLAPRKTGAELSRVDQDKLFFGGEATGTPYLELVAPFLSPAFMPC